MSTRVESDEIHITRSEKALAMVLAVFLLVGGLWVYSQPLDRTDDYAPVLDEARPTAAERSALARRDDARAELRRSRRAVEQARGNLEIRREAYRTELDAGRTGTAVERSFRRAEREFTSSQARTRRSAAAVEQARPAAAEAERTLAARGQRQDRRIESEREDRERDTFLLRLGWVLAVLAAGFVLQARLRRRRSRYLTAGFAVVGFATLQALVMASDYTLDHIDVGELGPAVLSAAGVTMSLGAMVGLQRYLARRLPARRVEKRECPVCAYPVAGNRFCEGCGREVVAECSACGSARRVGTARCGACGAV